MLRSGAVHGPVLRSDGAAENPRRSELRLVVRLPRRAAEWFVAAPDEIEGAVTVHALFILSGIRSSDRGRVARIEMGCLGHSACGGTVGRDGACLLVLRLCAKSSPWRAERDWTAGLRRVFDGLRHPQLLFAKSG